MRTIYQLLKKLSACPRACNKYKNSGRKFKDSFINCYHEDGDWIGRWLFAWPMAHNYPNLPSRWNGSVSPLATGRLFRKKANRIKYWPEVRKRLKEIGVKL